MSAIKQSAFIQVLVVDDELDNLKAIERVLKPSYDTVIHQSPISALKEVEEKDFAVVISDHRMPEMPGTEFLKLVSTKSPKTSRIILTAYSDVQLIREAVNKAEIFRYINKPWDNHELLAATEQAVLHYRVKLQNEKLINELEEKNQRLLIKEVELKLFNQRLEGLVEERTRELRDANEKLNELAMTDPLTNILNRRAFFKKLSEEIERCKRYHHPLTIAMLDVDHFKNFNDSLGHISGDEALKKISELLLQKLRKTDVLCRYGGEEFALIMPETKVTLGTEICERLRKMIAAFSFENTSANKTLTLSIGVSGFPEEKVECLLENADRALYQAKKTGRNKVVTHEPISSQPKSERI